MRAVVQRVHYARVLVEGAVIGSIDAGVCVLLGVTHDDTVDHAVRLAAKLAKLRIFSDDEGKMNRSVIDTAGSALIVSQFTLYGDAAKGNRPSFIDAARPDHAEPLITRLIDELRDLGVPVATGQFQADMDVELSNDGPVTIILEI